MDTIIKSTPPQQSPKENPKQRVLYLDVLRFCATLGVIFLHVTGWGYSLPIGTYNWYVALFGNSLVQWVVVVFVMISGALFLNPDKQITTKDIYHKYIKRLLITYLFWWIAYGCISLAVTSISAHSLVFKMNYLIPHFHLWFLPMLMGVYVFIPILRKVVTDSLLTKYVLIIWFGYIVISFIIGAIGVEIPQISVLFIQNIVVGYVGYFLLGKFVSSLTLEKKGIKIVILVGILGAITILLGNIIVSRATENGGQRFSNDLSPHIAMMAVSIFVVIKEKSYRFGGFVYKMVEYVRKDLFGIYLIHGIYLLFFNRTFFRDLGNHIITLPIISIAVFSASLFTCKLMRKIPLLKRVVE